MAEPPRAGGADFFGPSVTVTGSLATAWSRRLEAKVSASWRLTLAISETGRKAATASSVKSGGSVGESAPEVARSAAENATATAEPGRQLEERCLAREVAIEAEADAVVVPHQLEELGAPALGRLEGDELGEALDGIADMRGQAAEPLARGGAEAVDAPAHEERRQAHVEEEGEERERRRPREHR